MMALTTIRLKDRPPSTNNLFASSGKRRPRTKAYKRWQTAAGWQLKVQRPVPARGPVVVLIALPRGKTRRRADADNYAKPILDLLVTHDVLPDDSSEWVHEVRIKWADQADVTIDLIPAKTSSAAAPMNAAAVASG